MPSEPPADRGQYTPSSAVSRIGPILAASISSYFVAFVASAVLSRLLGPYARGVYYLPILAATTALAFCKLGVDQANVYLYGSASVPLERLAGQNALVAAVVGGVGCAVTIGLPWIWPGLFGTTPVVYLILAGFTVPFGIHTQLSGGLLSLVGQATRQYRAALVASVIQILVLGGLAALGMVTPGTALAAALVMAVAAWVVVMKPLLRLSSIGCRLDMPLLSATVRHAVVLHLASLLLFLHFRMDMFMVRAWIGPDALGQYSVSVILAETLPLATESVALAVLPQQLGNSLTTASALAIRAAKAAFLFGLVLALGWLVVGRPLIRIVYGEAYAGVYAPLVALLPGVTLLGIQRVCSAPTLRAGRPGLIVAISMGALSLNALLNVFWIPRWGVIGASLASSVSYTLSCGLLLFWTSRLARTPLWRVVHVAPEDWQSMIAGLRQLALGLQARMPGSAASKS